ncbi:MAG: hypothetical protein AAGF74_14685 [Pseudomonadota bacterium]
MVSRRAAVVAILAAAAGAYAFRRPPPSELQNIIADAFGNDVARAAPTQRFLADLLSLSGQNGAAGAAAARASVAVPGMAHASEAELDPEEELAELLLQAFAMSTNAVRAYETGEELSYDGLFKPYSAPCSNRLSAQWL